MTGRHWFRKDVLLPIFYTLAYGAGLYWLSQQLQRAPEVAGSDFVQMAWQALLVIYLLLVLITIRHVSTSYDLERYDPGDPASLKRLMRRRRFHLPRRPISEQAMLVALEQTLLDRHYRMETESHQIGRIYRRRHPAGFIGNLFYDRVIILQHEPLNVLMVDQLLQDSIRYIRAQTEKPSRRNLLIMVTRMSDPAEVASAAAGVVNFLGKFKGGTLCPFLLATRQYRLFYPADRTLLPRSHRFFQDCLRYRLKKVIRNVRGQRGSEILQRTMPAAPAAPTAPAWPIPMTAPAAPITPAATAAPTTPAAPTTAAAPAAVPEPVQAPARGPAHGPVPVSAQETVRVPEVNRVP